MREAFLYPLNMQNKKRQAPPFIKSVTLSENIAVVCFFFFVRIKVCGRCNDYSLTYVLIFTAYVERNVHLAVLTLNCHGYLDIALESDLFDISALVYGDGKLCVIGGHGNAGTVQFLAETAEQSIKKITVGFIEIGAL